MAIERSLCQFALLILSKTPPELFWTDEILSFKNILFIHIFTYYLLRACWMPDTVIGTGDSVIKKKWILPSKNLVEIVAKGPRSYSIELYFQHGSQ